MPVITNLDLKSALVWIITLTVPWMMYMIIETKVEVAVLKAQFCTLNESMESVEAKQDIMLEAVYRLSPSIPVRNTHGTP